MFKPMSEVTDGMRVRLTEDEEFYTVRNLHRGSMYGGTVFDIVPADGSPVRRDCWAGPSLMVEVAE